MIRAWALYDGRFSTGIYASLAGVEGGKGNISKGNLISTQVNVYNTDVALNSICQEIVTLAKQNSYIWPNSLL